MTLVVAVSLALSALASPASALQAGALDPSFATGGQFVRDYSPGHADGFSAVTTAADGSVFAAGGLYDSGSSKGVPFVAKFTPAGVPDITFGVGGVATIATAQPAYAKSLTIAPSGAVLAAGNYGAGQLFVARLTSAGTPDGTFGGGGVITRIWPLPADVSGVLSMPDGGALVGGTDGVGDVATATYQRFDASGNNYSGPYKASGAVGRTYSDSGKGTQMNALAGTGDGGFFGVGTATFGGKVQLVAFKIDKEGYQDASFAAGDGAYALADAQTLGMSAALQPDGRLVAGGDASNDGVNFQPAVARFTAAGALDPSFAGSGISVVPPLGNERNYGLALQPDGAILAVGSANDEKLFSVLRLTAAGAPDPLFGTGGRSTIALEPAGASALSAAIQPSGRILVAGGTASADSQDAADSALVGLLGTGQPPVSKIATPGKSKLKVRKFSKIAGTAGPEGDVAKVEVAIRRIDAKQLRRKRCVWVSSNKGRVKKVKDSTGKCAKPVWIKASGTAKWSFKLKKRLAAGSYRLYSRATLSTGATETSFTTRSGNLKKLKLAKK